MARFLILPTFSLPAIGRAPAWVCGLFLMAFSWLAPGAHAQSHAPAAASAPASPITVRLTQMKVLVDHGKETLAPADQVKPGDIVEYRAVYTNAGSKPVSQLVATLPLPAGLEYTPRSAKPAAPAAEAAAKDGRYAPEPLKRAVAGQREPQLVPYDEYRSLRWKLGRLDAGAHAEVSARARVVIAAAPAAASSVGAAPAKP